MNALGGTSSLGRGRCSCQQEEPCVFPLQLVTGDVAHPCIVDPPIHCALPDGAFGWDLRIIMLFTCYKRVFPVGFDCMFSKGFRFMMRCAWMFLFSLCQLISCCIVPRYRLIALFQCFSYTSQRPFVAYHSTRFLLWELSTPLPEHPITHAVSGAITQDHGQRPDRQEAFYNLSMA